MTIKIIKWMIFYDDGSEFSNLDGKPYDAPRQGVICITQGDRIIHGSDTYCFEDDHWVEHDRDGCERYLNNERYPVRLLGYTIPRDKFLKIFDKAKKYKQR